MPKDSTVEDLDTLLKQARSARRRLEGDWYLNLAFYENRQWMAWDGKQLYRPPMPRSRLTIVDNRITPVVEKDIARITKSRPVFTVTPQSPDGEDANAAELGEQVMRYLWKHLNLQELTLKALRWSRICGAGFLKTFWDPSIGDSVEVLMTSNGQPFPHPETGAPVKADSPEAGIAQAAAQQQTGRPLVVKRIAIGDIRCEVRSPFQMYIDPLADTFEEAEWLVEESVKSVEAVRRRYNVDIQADAPANPGLVEARIGGSLGGVSQYKGVRVREYWCKPNSTHPQGCRAVWVGTAGDKKSNGQILAQQEGPFDPMPYVMLSGIPVPGRMWPTSVVEMLRGPQTELNKVKSQIAENRNRIGNPTLLYSRVATRDAEELDRAISLPGGKLGYDETGSPNAVPSYLKPPDMPEYVIEEIARIEESIQEISGQHEVTSAQVPPGVTAASAINLLMEADDTRLGPVITDYELQLGKFGQKMLSLAARYYTDQRTIRLAGDNGAFQIFDFRGAMLRDNTAVEVQAGSAFPHSKAAKQAQMQDFLTYMAQSGQPIQGRQLAQFMEDWGFGGQARFIEQYTGTEVQCNRENALMAQGARLPIHPYDDDEQHIANHEDWQRTPRYAVLIAQAPQIDANVEEHVEAHRQKLAQIQQQQAQMQLQAQGQDPQAEAQAQQQQAQAQSARQQMDLKDAQTGQQLGSSQAQSEQQQRHTEEKHQQSLRHAEEQHQSRLRQQAQAQRQGAQK